MRPMRCNVFHHSGTSAGLVLTMYGVYDCWLIYGSFILPCHTDEHLCIPCCPLHSALPWPDFAILVLNRCFVFLGWSTLATTLLLRSREKLVQLERKVCLSHLLW